MSRCCLIRLILSASFVVVGFNFPTQSFAMSKGYDGDAQVVLKDGVPCFFAILDADDKPSRFGQTLVVSINRGAVVWHIDEDRGLAAMPGDESLCVKYGLGWSSGKVLVEPVPLKYGVPYLADIVTKRRYRAEFCLAKNVRNEPFLTKWASDGDHCLDEPLNEADKPSLWQRLFGK
ncbi:MAG: hypothetical protein JWL63_302 [Rhodocyclales bacterium]|nr:hypothetical protein [Rhodocyclales bacterium]